MCFLPTDIKELLKIAEKSDIDAELELCTRYIFGYGGAETNYKTAMEWYQKVLNRLSYLDSEALNKQENYYYLYKENLNTILNGKLNSNESADNKLDQEQEKSKKLNENDKLYEIAELLFYKKTHIWGTRQKAIAWFLMLAERGHIRSQYQIGYIYAENLYKSIESKQAKEFLRSAAKQGDSNAQAVLGKLYSRQGNSDFPKDSNEAMRWLETASKNGSAQGKFYLAIAYFKGQDTMRDYTKAYKLFLSVASAMNVLECDLSIMQKARYMLGILSQYGMGIEQDIVKAAQWYRTISLNIRKKEVLPLYEIKALFKLAKMYETGEGIEKNENKAFKYYSLIEQHYPPAEYRCGVCYEKGIGTRVSLYQAYQHYTRAANRGYAKALFKIGTEALLTDDSGEGKIPYVQSSLIIPHVQHKLGIKGIDKLKEAASKGSIDAEFEIARLRMQEKP